MKRKRKTFWWLTSAYSVILTWFGYLYWSFLASNPNALTVYLIIMAIGSIVYIVAIALIQFGED